MRPEPRHWGHILWARMRPFARLLLAAYIVGTLAFWIIPGRLPTGESFNMGLVDALYMAAITATTIGFGEIPFPFTAAQRGFTMVYAHLVVLCWLLFAGGFIATIQSRSFQRAFMGWRFRRQVASLREPFCVVVGYGQTGVRTVDYLTDYGIACVVIDKNPARIELLDTVDFSTPVLGLVADGSVPDNLLAAGVGRGSCSAVVVLTDSDRSNLGAATAIKLLAPDRRLFVRSEHDETGRNLLSFGVEDTLDPFRLFARKLALRVDRPMHFAVADQLLDPGQRRIEVPKPVARNGWILCGFGRLGRACEDAFGVRGLALNVIDPKVSSAPPKWVTGLGTEERTLRAAGLADVSGVIAGTNHDADNLSIWMTAKLANPDLVGIGRLNRPSSLPAFSKAGWDLIMHPADVIAEELVGRLRTPMLRGFLVHLEQQDDAWISALMGRIQALCGDVDLENWDTAIKPSRTPKLMPRLGELTIDDLAQGPVMCLKLRRSGERLMLPAGGTRLYEGDELLFWGAAEGRARMLKLFH